MEEEVENRACNGGGQGDLADARVSCGTVVRNRAGEGHSCLACSSIIFT